jgi:hypothetical protein
VRTRTSPGAMRHLDALTNGSEQSSEKGDLRVRKAQGEGTMFDCIQAEQRNQLFDAREIVRLASTSESIRWTFSRTRT